MKSRVLATIPGVIACAFVDLRNGSFRQLYTLGSHPPEFRDYLATTTRTYFDGDSVRTIKAVLDEASPEPTIERRIDEIVLNSTHSLHVMVRLPRDLKTALVVVTRNDTKLGLALNAVREIAADPAVGGNPDGADS